MNGFIRSSFLHSGQCPDSLMEHLKKSPTGFPGDPVVKTPCFGLMGRGFDPWSTHEFGELTLAFSTHYGLMTEILNHMC